MSTQGLVTFTHKAAVAVKVVAGCNGYNANAVAREVDPSDSPQTIWETALKAGFGCESCLMVITPNEIYPEVDSNEVKERARRTFNQSRFNPRWDCGLADYTVVL